MLRGHTECWDFHDENEIELLLDFSCTHLVFDFVYDMRASFSLSISKFYLLTWTPKNEDPQQTYK